MEYIIIQAGGKGTRLGSLTKNKPKALTPVDNLPMIFHLFHKYPDKRFIVIADYQKKALRKYLAAFADVKYQVVDALGSGTCAGIKQAIDLIPKNRQFMLIWSDLILSKNFVLPEEYRNSSISTGDTDGNKSDKNDGFRNYVGISKTFFCRWRYEKGEFSEKRSEKFGVGGLFLFKNKDVLEDIPESGEFVRWLRDKNVQFETVNLAGTREFGILEEYEKHGQIKTRPFNKISIEGATLLKEPVDEQGRALAVKECAWYDRVRELNISGIPEIYETNPLRMEYIRGKNIYEYVDDGRKKILKKLVASLEELHATDSIPADSFSMKEAYYNKTMRRLSKVENIVPFAKEKYIRINGRNCRNIFYYSEKLEKKLEKLRADKFPLIHGDCTFSNLIIRDSGEPVLIDPRGYFGFTELYGDVRYDWAKLYYSIVGNYDQFNLKKFNLDIGGQSVLNGKLLNSLEDTEVKIQVKSSGWEDMENEFFMLTGADEYEIKLLHAVIWLSLTTYAWQDYDSICGAFYNGLYYLEEVL